MGRVSRHAPLQILHLLRPLIVADLGFCVPHRNRAAGKDAGGMLCWATLGRDAWLQRARRLYWGESGLSGPFWLWDKWGGVALSGHAPCISEFCCARRSVFPAPASPWEQQEQQETSSVCPVDATPPTPLAGFLLPSGFCETTLSSAHLAVPQERAIQH